MSSRAEQKEIREKQSSPGQRLIRCQILPLRFGRDDNGVLPPIPYCLLPIPYCLIPNP